jgi:TatD DNase family protein
MSVLVDAHCHLDLYRNPRAIAGETEERRIHTIAVTNAPSVFFHTRDLARGTKYLHAAVGLHPELVHSHGHELPQLLNAIAANTFVGEVGLDYQTSDRSIRARQKQVLGAVLDRCAGLRDKILTLHSRRAASDVIAAIGENFPCPAILHWFSGSKKDLRTAVCNGLYFSVNPSMVRSKTGTALINEMPRDHVLTETDGPFVEVRGRPATPEYVSEVISAIATLWREPSEVVANHVAANFERIVSETTGRSY